MSLLNIMLTFPTAVFSALMVIVLLYWLMVIIGVVDLGHGEAEGAAEGLAEGAAEGAMDGVAEGAMHGVAEGAMDGVAEGAMDGVAEGAMDGVAEGAMDGVAEAGMHGVAEGAAEAGMHGAAEAHGHDVAHDPGATEGAGAASGLASAIGFGRAPVTVVFSLIIFYGWVLSILGTRLLGGNLGAVLPGVLFKLLIAVAAVVLALVLTSVSSRPLGRVFVVHQAPRRSTLIGRVCTVATGRVDAGFGQAEVDDGGAGLLIQVRCDEDNPLRRGDEALIISFDDQREAFVVEPYGDLRG